MGQVLGFVGWPCAGKDEAAGYLKRAHGARCFGHSDFIRRLAAIQGNLNPTTDQLCAVFETQAAVNGYHWIARQVQESVRQLWEKKPEALVVVSGVRNLAEVKVYKELNFFTLVKLEVDFLVRLARARERQRMGEQGLTRTRFQEIERLPGNANISDLMALDGPVIINNGSNKLPFYRELDRLVNGKG